MKAAIQVAPIAVWMTVYEDFVYYSGGVYEYIWGGNIGGHFVVLTGWDDAEQCWIGKNSYGDWWGEDTNGATGQAGWFRIRWGAAGIEYGAVIRATVPGCSCPDADGDGYQAESCTDPLCPLALDCDDGDGYIHPGAAELCDGWDNDCDGAFPADEADQDGDGWMICEGDCDDLHAALHPGAAEVCGNPVDEDCDGIVDDPDVCGGDDDTGDDDTADDDTGDDDTTPGDDDTGDDDIADDDTGDDDTTPGDDDTGDDDDDDDTGDDDTTPACVSDLFPGPHTNVPGTPQFAVEIPATVGVEYRTFHVKFDATPWWGGLECYNTYYHPPVLIPIYHRMASLQYGHHWCEAGNVFNINMQGPNQNRLNVWVWNVEPPDVGNGCHQYDLVKILEHESMSMPEGDVAHVEIDLDMPSLTMSFQINGDSYTAPLHADQPLIATNNLPLVFVLSFDREPGVHCADEFGVEDPANEQCCWPPSYDWMYENIAYDLCE